MRRGLVLASVGLVAVGAVLVRQRAGHHAEALAPAVLEPPSIARILPLAAPEPGPSPLAGLDLARIAVDDDGAMAPAADHRVAHLTLDPELQRAAQSILATRQIPEASLVLVDVASGKVLAYASYLAPGEHDRRAPPRRDLNAEATAPSASVFKIITASALVEEAGLGPDTKECYGGGEQKLLDRDLEEDPQRDKWCTTLAGAMGHSTNAVFAKLALHNLKPQMLDAMAQRFGFDQPVPFDAPNDASMLRLPPEPYNFARTAAGFWNSTLSPLQAAWLSTTVARGGEAPRLSIVEDVKDAKGTMVYTAPPPSVSHRAIARETAQAVTSMMEVTVAEGTSYRAFHDLRGRSFLPNMQVAGKTGTLTDANAQRYYTWFTGFAPSRPVEGGAPQVRQVAISVLVVNGPVWHAKANVVAREMLREYLASRGVEGVSHPDLDPQSASRRRSTASRK
jgi:cell division protein FtsI/penicillin-binding protein 2